eukprot:SAG31_NODE_10308_length_1156_cov_1.631977_1_plen_312_part_10
MVNGGAASGGHGPFDNRTAVMRFYKEFVGPTHGSTNVSIAVTSVYGLLHWATWISDSGTGSSKATWGIDSESGRWVIVKDELVFEPGVPKAAVEHAMFEFERLYNATEYGKGVAACLSSQCKVTIIGDARCGKTHKQPLTQLEFAEFLAAKSSSGSAGGLGGPVLQYALTQLGGMSHQASWCTDTKSGSSEAVWGRVLEGGERRWAIIELQFLFSSGDAESESSRVRSLLLTPVSPRISPSCPDSSRTVSAVLAEQSDASESAHRPWQTTLTSRPRRFPGAAIGFPPMSMSFAAMYAPTNGRRTPRSPASTN